MDYDNIGELVRRGVLLFAKIAPVPSAFLIAAVGAAAVSKFLELRDRRVTEILSSELTLDHIPYVEPSERDLLSFYLENPIYPDLAKEFAEEISVNDIDRLSALYPFLYSALVLKREIPSLLFHREMEEKKFRELAEKYEVLSRGYHSIEGDAPLKDEVDRFGAELLEAVDEVYGAMRDELRNTENKLMFDLIDYIRDVSLAERSEG